jgi:hypothetical protein
MHDANDRPFRRRDQSRGCTQRDVFDQVVSHPNNVHFAKGMLFQNEHILTCQPTIATAVDQAPIYLRLIIGLICSDGGGQGCAGR